MVKLDPFRAVAFLLLSTFVLAGCHLSHEQAAPAESEAGVRVKDTRSLPALAGSWKAGGSTYEMMRYLHYKIDSVTLELHKDSTFEAIHLPDCVLDTFGRPVHAALFNASGTWKVEDYDPNGLTVYLSFTSPHREPFPYSLQFDIYQTGRQIKLDEYIGDPDEGKVLEFSKPR